MRARILLPTALLLLALASPVAAVVGDLDSDTDVDVDDIAIILAAVNTPAAGPLDPKDLDSDGTITALDARVAVTLCTRPLCATGNNPPTLNAIGNQSVDELQTLMFTATATDPNVGDTLTFSLDAASLAAGMTINGATGAFSWTPTEAQGPGVFSVTVTVTDDGTLAMSDFETFDITVNEVNVAPVLGAIGNQSVDELVNLAFNATATDADLPANTLTYSLDAASLASGMTINGATGAFSWTPTEAQGPGVFSVTVTVTDDGTPAMSDFETFDITVNEVNVAPVLGAIGNQSIDELVNLAFNATATDADLPANTLTYSLDAASLASGMTINGATGAFSWTPTEAQGPGVFSVTVTVTDDGTPAMSDFETFDITVNEVNVAPVLGAIGNQSVDELVNLAFNAMATDADLPANTLTYSLDAASLASGMTINGATGAFSWTPTEAQGPGVFSVTVTVTDDGTPAMSDFETFDITVNEVNLPPVVTGESFEGIVNTLLEHSAAPNTLSSAAQVHTVGSLLSNDSDADLPAQALTVSLNSQATAGAAITVNADGTFTYVSAPGDNTGSDSFTYTVSDGNGGMTNGTVTINFFQQVWYVQDNAAPGGLGRSSDPFDTLAEAQAASLVNDFIFVFQGNTGTTPIDEGIALKSGQKFHGEGVGLSVNVGLNGNPAPTNLVPPNPGNEPEIDFTGGSAVTVTANNAAVTGVEIRGLNLTSSTAGGNNAIDASATGAAGALGVLVGDNVIGGATNEGIRVSHAGSATSTVTVVNNTITATGNAFDARTSGAGDLELAFDGNTGITSAAAAGAAVHVEDVAGTGSLFVTSFSNNAVLGTTNGDGVRVLGAIFDSDPTDADFDLVAGGTLTVGAVVDRVPRGVSLGTPANRVRGNLGFGTLNVFTFNGAALSASGTAAATGGPPPTAGFLLAIAAGTADAILGPAVAFDPLTSAVLLTSISSANSGGAGISLNAVNGVFGVLAGGITGSLGPGFQIIGGTVVATYSGNIVQSTNAPAVAVSGGHNTGLVSFNTGTIIATNGTGLQFDNADGTYQFTGTVTLGGGDAGIDILNGSAGGFIFGSSTTITSPSGPAFNLVGGTAGVTYSGNITQANNAPAVSVSGGHTTGTVTFQTGTISASGGTGLQFSNADSVTSYNFTGTVTLNGGDAGVDILSGSAGTFNFGSNTTITSPTGPAFVVDSSSANVDYAGSITQNNAAAGVGINANAGIVTFRGGLTLNTGGATAFAATGGGMVNVCADDNCSTAGGTAVVNTIGATTPLSGTAVNISGTVIGTENVTFREISVDAGAAGPDSTAIILANTGIGEFTVTGVGSTAGSGGTIENLTDVDAITFDTTDGRISLSNMIIEDIADSGDGGNPIGTRSQTDGIQGANVNGGLVLNNVTMRRFSDNAILGSSTADGLGFTVWNGLEIRDSVLENSNRYHLDQGAAGPSDDLADDSNEGLVRILGIRGTVVIDNSTLQRGGELIDFFTDTSGTLDMTVQRSNFLDPVKEFLCSPPGTVNVGKNCIDVEVRGSNSPVIRIGDPAEANPALGNAFLNCGTSSVRLLHAAGATGAVQAVISRNTFTIIDHLTGPPGCPTGSFQFNHPQGGVALNTGGGAMSSYEAIVSNNLFDQIMHASGFLGQLSINADDAGVAEVIVRGNDFRLPWDAGIEVRADGNSDARILFDANTYTDGTVGGAGDPGGAVNDVGFSTPSPFNPFLVNVRNGGSLDLTLRNEILHQHDDVSSGFANSFDSSINASGGTLDLAIFGTMACSPPGTLCTSKSPDGYNLERNGGTFNLFSQENAITCAGVPTAQAILQDNNNSGGSNNDDTSPPVVATTGTINCVNVAPTLPAIVIP